MILAQVDLDQVSDNILLGIFPDEQAARAAHAEWHKQHDDDPDADPWGELVLIPIELNTIVALEIQHNLVTDTSFWKP